MDHNFDAIVVQHHAPSQMMVQKNMYEISRINKRKEIPDGVSSDWIFVLEIYFAEAAEVISHRFWFNDNKDL